MDTGAKNGWEQCTVALAVGWQQYPGIGYLVRRQTEKDSWTSSGCRIGCCLAVLLPILLPISPVPGWRGVFMVMRDQGFYL